MIVSHSKQFIFFHNPKCAGTSLRAALESHHDDPFTFWGIFDAPFFRNDIDHTHLRLWEMQVLFPHIIEAARTYRSVIFVRNPYQRFISAVDEHFKKFQHSVPLASMPAVAQTEAIEHFIDETLSIARVTTDYRFIHFSPQTWFIRLGDRRIPANVLAMDEQGAFISRAFECLGLSPQTVTPSNRSHANLAHVLASPKIAAFVRRFYALDFDFLAADPALRHLLPLRSHNDETHTQLSGATATTHDYHQMGYPSLLDDMRAFNEADYLSLYPGIVEAIQAGNFPDGWSHYERHGRFEGRRISIFDETFYLGNYKQVAHDLGSRLAPTPYEHYVMFGRARGYLPHANATPPQHRSRPA